MRCGEFALFTPDLARKAAIAAVMMAGLCSSASAVQPPEKHCRQVSKIEYDSAKRQYLLAGRFGSYIRTRRLWRHYYWYCHGN